MKVAVRERFGWLPVQEDDLREDDLRREQQYDPDRYEFLSRSSLCASVIIQPRKRPLASHLPVERAQRARSSPSLSP